MRFFEGFFSLYVLDAEGRPRRVYPLWAWWRSPWVRGDVPREVYAAICADALRRSEDAATGVPHQSPATPLPKPEPAWATWASRAIVAGLVLYFWGRLLLTWSFWIVALPLIAAFMVIWTLFIAPASSRLGRLRGRWLAPVLGGRSDDIAGAMVANGRCASCAHQLDVTEEESPGILRCHECGAAWRSCAIVGGDAALG